MNQIQTKIFEIRGVQIILQGGLLGYGIIGFGSGKRRLLQLEKGNLFNPKLGTKSGVPIFGHQGFLRRDSILLKKESRGGSY